MAGASGEEGGEEEGEEEGEPDVHAGLDTAEAVRFPKGISEGWRRASSRGGF